MITGNDKKSIAALKMLNQGYRHKEIEDQLNISINNIKRLSRYNKILTQAQEKLSVAAQNKLAAIGTKSLVLIDLFKNNEYELLDDILIMIDENIKRSDLAKLPGVIKEKQESLETAKTYTDQELTALEDREKILEEKLHELKESEEELKEATKFIGKCDKRTRDFLEDHLGISKGDVVLLKRLYHSWQQDLRRDRVIRYCNKRKVWIVENIEALKTDTNIRIESGEKISWDENDLPMIYYNYNIPNERYKLAEDVTSNLKNTIGERKQEINTLKKERRKIKRRIKALKEQSVSRFMDAKDYSNYFSDLEIINHGILEHEAMKYLYGEGYITSNEIVLDNNKRVDIAGFNKYNNMIIIEAKASMQDFLQDTKWKEYLNYCNQFYFIFGSWSFNKNKILERLDGSGVGILLFEKDSNSLKIIKKADTNPIENYVKDKLSFSIVRRANQKLIQGF